MHKIVLFLSWWLAASVYAVPARELVPAPPMLNADAYLLMDFKTGRILVQHNADEPLPPASLTKLMTAYILAQELQLGRLELDDKVEISENAWSQNPVFRGSSLMWIEPGKPVTVAELERGIVISSGNDATVAIAEHIAGSEKAFVGLMNRYAGSMGLTGTHFENSHGLPSPNHVSTARDLAVMASSVIRDHPERYKVYREKSYTYNDIFQNNRNRLLRKDKSVDGLKTGYTRDAGYGLVASAEREGMRLISVVLGSVSVKSRENETRKMLNYGFRFFETITPVRSEQMLGEYKVWKGMGNAVPVGTGESVQLTVARSNSKVEINWEVKQPLIAPLVEGQIVGNVSITRSGETLAEIPLRVLSSVEKAGFFSGLRDSVLLWLNGFSG